jgi:hypothetical protein
MELLFVTIIAFAIGLLARYVLPGRDTYGVVLVPSLAAIATAIAWVAFTWAGWKFDGGWIWGISLAIAAVVSFAVVAILPRVRRAGDDQLLARLSRA